MLQSGQAIFQIAGRFCDHRPNRIQNRLTETVSTHRGPFYTRAFVNEPDTDWSLAPNREWAEQIRNKWKKAASDPPMKIPVVIAGQDIWDDRETRDCNDLSQIKLHQTKPVTVARYALAQADDIETAVKTARMDPEGWRTKSMEERHEILGRVAMARVSDWSFLPGIFPLPSPVAVSRRPLPQATRSFLNPHPQPFWWHGSCVNVSGVPVFLETPFSLFHARVQAPEPDWSGIPAWISSF